MSINALGMTIESLVAILLAITIAYCVILNRRLKSFRSIEQSLKATISELVTATEIAERAIAGLKETVREGDVTLGERLRAAERVSIGLDLQIAAGKDSLKCLAEAVTEARSRAEPAALAPVVAQPPARAPAPAPMPLPPRDAKSVAAAAQAFAERLRTRVHGLAA